LIRDHRHGQKSFFDSTGLKVDFSGAPSMTGHFAISQRYTTLAECIFVSFFRARGNFS
jgi:hypothetical protein